MDTIELRQRFLQEFVTHHFDYHDEDAKRVRESDFWVKRFIVHKQQGANAAYYHMKDTFKWKKSFGVHDFKPLDIPSEIYELAPLFDYLPDRNGVVLIYVRMKCIVKIDILDKKMKQSFAYLMDKVDNQVRKPRGWALIFDCQEAGLENANFDLLFFALETVGKHFPMQPKYVLAYGIPWLLRPFVTMGLGVIPKEARDLLTFADTKEQLFERVAPENVPDFMGGSATKDYREVPTGAKSIFELGKELYKLSEADIKALMEPLSHLFDEINMKSNGKSSDGGDNNNSSDANSFMLEFD